MPTKQDAFFEHPPPWIAFPELQPHESANQGVVEAYIVLEWLPFWTGLSDVGRIAYLYHWKTSPEWRKAIAERYGQNGIDYAAEALEATESEHDRTATRPKRRLSLFRRLSVFIKS